MARQKLTALLPEAQNPSAQSDPVRELVPTEASTPAFAVIEEAPPQVSREPEPEPTSAAARRTKRTKPASASDHVHYAQLIRKEARFREDQIDDLAARARKLSRARTGTDVRITDNTLIRVAVDLLLSRAEDLRGNTEAELRKSVGL